MSRQMSQFKENDGEGSMTGTLSLVHAMLCAPPMNPEVGPTVERESH